jgi:hypothetical protein
LQNDSPFYAFAWRWRPALCKFGFNTDKSLVSTPVQEEQRHSSP